MPVLLPLAPLAEKWCPVGWKRVVSIDCNGHSAWPHVYNAEHMYALFGFPFKWFDMCIFVQFLSKNIYIQRIHYHIHVCITVYTFAHVKYLTGFYKWSHRMAPDRHRCSMDWLLLLLLCSVRCFVRGIYTVNLYSEYVQCALHWWIWKELFRCAGIS